MSAAIMVVDAQQKLTEQPPTSLIGSVPPQPKYWWDHLHPLFAELMLVTPDPVAELGWEGLVVRGRYSPQAPLAAVRDALTVAQHEQLLVIDPFLPVLTPEIVDWVATHAEKRWDVMALGGDMLPEIVPIVFHKRCLKIMEHHLAQTDYDLNKFFHQVRLEIFDIKTFAD